MCQGHDHRTGRFGIQTAPLSFCLLVAITLLISGCASTGKSPGNPQLISFLQDGQTSRQEILARLGCPTLTMEDESILFFRLGEDRGGGYFIRELDKERWAGVRYSLVLILDDAGVLKEHSLVNVR
jgi:hypothetical protein